MLDLRRTLPDWVLNKTDPLIPICKEIYLVGGAVRNILLGKAVDDFDFVVVQDSIPAARKAADILSGKFFILDTKRQTARALIPFNGKTIKLDFALFNGRNIFEDLNARDFTINAMAIKLPANNEILDPNDGQKDLELKFLRPCSESSFMDDPVRAIRYVRFQEELGLYSTPQTDEMVKHAASFLGKVSGERQRDALLDVFRISDLKKAVNRLMDLGIIKNIIPEIAELHAVGLTPPHIYNGWDHTLQVLHYCQQITSILVVSAPIDPVHPRLQQAMEMLSKYKNYLVEYLNEPLCGERTRYLLLIIGILFHDAAKSVVEYEFNGERKKFPGHAREGADIVKNWARSKGFSKKEIEFLSRVVRVHMKPSKPEMVEEGQNRIGVYHYFKISHDAGIASAILHLADVLATYEDALTDLRWNEAISAVENIFNAYFIHFSEFVSPHVLLNGKELIRKFNIPQGEKIGELLDRLEEAQISGEVTNKDQALTFITRVITQI